MSIACQFILIMAKSVFIEIQTKKRYDFNRKCFLYLCPDKELGGNFMIKRLYKILILVFSAVFILCSVCFADLLTVLPKIAEEEMDKYSGLSIRFKDTSKLIEDLYPTELFKAAELMSNHLELDSLVKAGNVVKALSESNLREFAFMIIMDNEKSKTLNCGVILSVPDSQKMLDEINSSEECTLFDLVLAIGGNQLLEAIKAVDDPLQDIDFKRDSDGVYSHKDDYVFIEGDKIVIFDTKETTLSVAGAIRSEINARAADYESQNVFLVNIPLQITNSNEGIKAEIRISYENSTWKIKTISNAFRLISKSRGLEKETLENAQKALSNIPMVGKGEPFFIGGINTFINDADNIEERLMDIGDMILTLNWAMFLQAAQQYGISRNDIGNILSGTAVVVLGLDCEFFEIPIPLGGYLAFTGKNNASARIIKAISESAAHREIMTETIVDGWDSVYAITIDPMVPNVLVAQSGETLLIGVMNSEDLRTKLDTEKMGIFNEKAVDIIILSYERIWKAVRKAYVLLNEMLTSEILGDLSDIEKEAVKFIQRLLNTDFPMNEIKLLIMSQEEIDLNIIMNPAPEGDFWKEFFLWLSKLR